MSHSFPPLRTSTDPRVRVALASERIAAALERIAAAFEYEPPIHNTDSAGERWEGTD